MPLPPKGACDCHTHVFGPAHAYAFAHERNYTPPDAPVADARAFLSRIGFERVVLVQPTPYGDDDRRLLDALRELGSSARGVIAARSLTDRDLDERAALGVTALRLNAADRSVDDALPARIADAAALARDAGWHIEIQAPGTMLGRIAPAIARAGVAVALDHLGRLNDPGDPGLDVVCGLMRDGLLWVKLSGADRFPGWPASRGEVLTLMRTLLVAHPGRVVWGSDWPHTPFHERTPAATPALQPFRSVDVGGLLALLAEACADGGLYERVLVHNPSALYRFG